MATLEVGHVAGPADQASPVHSDIDMVTILNVSIILFSCTICNVAKCTASLIRHVLRVGIIF